MPRHTLNTHFVRTGCVQARRAIGVSLLAVALSLANVASAQDDKVVARVNGIDITAADVAVATEMYANQLGNMPDDARLSVIVDEMIALRLAADADKAANIPDDDSYKRQIAFFEAQTLRSVFLEKKVAKQVDDAAVRKAYDDRIGSIPPVEELRLRHILLPTEQEAKDVVVALNGGADFANLASERSRDEASKANGGDLGYVTTGQTMAEIDAAAGGLKPGEYTREPVASAFGFHIVKLEDRRSRPAPLFETVAEEIRASLKAADVEKLVPDVAPPGADDGHGHEAQ
jgi:peptidyl-prolyl cis-trans isomerase C